MTNELARSEALYPIESRTKGAAREEPFQETAVHKKSANALGGEFRAFMK